LVEEFVSSNLTLLFNYTVHIVTNGMMTVEDELEMMWITYGKEREIPVLN
jgi:hypothetical protein